MHFFSIENHFWPKFAYLHQKVSNFDNLMPILAPSEFSDMMQLDKWHHFWENLPKVLEKWLFREPGAFGARLSGAKPSGAFGAGQNFFPKTQFALKCKKVQKVQLAFPPL